MKTPPPKERNHLRRLIEASLSKQGFRVRDNQIVISKNPSKKKLRSLHRLSVQHRIDEAERTLGL